MKAVPRIKTRTRLFIVRRIARQVWDMANSAPNLPAIGAVLALVVLYFINR